MELYMTVYGCVSNVDALYTTSMCERVCVYVVCVIVRREDQVSH